MWLRSIHRDFTTREDRAARLSGPFQESNRPSFSDTPNSLFPVSEAPSTRIRDTKPNSKSRILFFLERSVIDFTSYTEEIYIKKLVFLPSLFSDTLFSFISCYPENSTFQFLRYKTQKNIKSKDSELLHRNVHYKILSILNLRQNSWYHVWEYDIIQSPDTNWVEWTFFNLTRNYIIRFTRFFGLTRVFSVANNQVDEIAERIIGEARTSKRTSSTAPRTVARVS